MENFYLWASGLVIDPKYFVYWQLAANACLIFWLLLIVQRDKKEKLAKNLPAIVSKKELSTVEQAVETKPLETATVEEKSTALNQGLRKTRSGFIGRLKGLLRGKKFADAEALLGKLEEILVSSDFGVTTSKEIIEKLKNDSDGHLLKLSEEQLLNFLKSQIQSILEEGQAKGIDWKFAKPSPTVLLVCGVNGVGKTTTIGKLANLYKNQGAQVMLGACDTYRAAAVEQLVTWGNRIEVPVIAGTEGEKPSTVAYRALESAQKENIDLLILDTAGRLHTRVNLMNELENIVNVVAKKQEGAPHFALLVVDGTTGQNALAQAREFKSRAKLNGVVVTKLDGTAKGGIVVGIKKELDLPVNFIGVGESINDLKPFIAKDFVDSIFEGEVDEVYSSDQEVENEITNSASEENQPRRKVQRRSKEETSHL